MEFLTREIRHKISVDMHSHCFWILKNGKSSDGLWNLYLSPSLANHYKNQGSWVPLLLRKIKVKSGLCKSRKIHYNTNNLCKTIAMCLVGLSRFVHTSSYHVTFSPSSVCLFVRSADAVFISKQFKQTKFKTFEMVVIESHACRKSRLRTNNGQQSRCFIFT